MMAALIGNIQHYMFLAVCNIYIYVVQLYDKNPRNRLIFSFENSATDKIILSFFL